MTFDRPRHILLYWGGEITYEGGTMSYRPMVCKKLFQIKQRIRFVELVDKIYELMKVDRLQLKLNILYRHIVSHGVYSGVPLTDDDGMDGIFDLFDADPSFCAELFIEIEKIPQVPVTNILGVYGIGPMMSLMHSIMDDQPLQSNAQSLFEHPFEFYNPMCSFSMSNSIQSDQSIGTQCNRDTTAGEGPSTMKYEHMEKCLVDEDLTDDNANSDSSWHALDEDYESESEDISNDDSDEDLGTNNGECQAQEDVPVYQPRGMTFFNDIGNYGDYDPMDRSDKDGLVYWNEEKNDIRLHMYFDSKEQVSKAVRMWSIAQKRKFKVIESRKRTWAAKCKTASSGRLAPGDCDWSIRVLGNESLTMWKVTKWVKDHVCIGEISDNDHV